MDTKKKKKLAKLVHERMTCEIEIEGYLNMKKQLVTLHISIFLLSTPSNSSSYTHTHTLVQLTQHSHTYVNINNNNRKICSLQLSLALSLFLLSVFFTWHVSISSCFSFALSIQFLLYLSCCSPWS